MKRYRTWLTIFAATVILLPLACGLTDILLQRALGLRRIPLDKDMEEKVYALVVRVSPSPEVIIAGDSRAERHLVPAVIEDKLGLSSVNVAVSSGELISAAKCFERYSVLKDKPIVILSATSFQFNNGSTDHDSLSMDSVVEMSWYEQLHIFRRKLPEMAYRKIRMYSKRSNAIDTDEQYAEKGFLGVEGRLGITAGQLAEGMSLDPAKTRHPWYKDLDVGDPKRRVFIDAVDRLARSGAPIVIINPPASPVFRECVKDTFIDRFEREYSTFLSEIADRYPNVHFLDYYSNWTDAFPNEQFYDVQHLNRQGAAALTARVCDEMIRLGLIAKTR